jgi:hypothetical protein
MIQCFWMRRRLAFYYHIHRMIVQHISSAVFPFSWSFEDVRGVDVQIYIFLTSALVREVN